MEMKTVFPGQYQILAYQYEARANQLPGFYANRTIHIHVQVHTKWKLRENGTIVAGRTVSTGQIYFTEKVSAKVMSLEPYASNTQIART